MTFRLVVKGGAGKGMSWPIGAQPLVLGRAETCDVVIPHLAVPRRHCELAAVDGNVRLRDLGSVNATRVNGRLVLDADLKEGDEVLLGGVLFVIAPAEAVLPPGPRPVADTPPGTVSLHNVFTLESRALDSVRAHLPGGAEELRELFVVGRMFGDAGGMDELLDVFNWHLRERFSPEALWMAWFLPGERRMVPVAFEDVSAEPPLEAMLAAVESSSGMILPGRIREGNARRFSTTLVAPLMAAGEPLAAAAIRTATPHTVYDENDLQYFVAVAHALAPHLRAMAHREQLQRDFELAQRQAGLLPALLGESPAISEVRRLIATAAASSLNVLLLGETGTGKELAARMLHDLSARAGRPFVVVNCAAVPRELFESAFFGHEKDAFTGATQRRFGYFEEAHGGTLFLDEVGDLSLDNQARILRAIETGTFYRIGSNQETRVDVRVLAATNRIEGLPEVGSGFRPDLYHRLSGFEIHMPPLRDHMEDLPSLVDHFLDEVRRVSGLPVARLGVDALDRLRAWLWPGNVRELRACIHRAAALARSGPIQAKHILLTPPAGVQEPADTRILSLAEAEKFHIAQMLRRMGGNIRATARVLGISRDTLYNKMKAYGLEV